MDDSVEANDFEGLQGWFDAIASAMSDFDQQLAQTTLDDFDEGLVAIGSAFGTFWLAVGEANEAIGHPLTRKQVRSAILKAWPSRSIEGAELRALVTSIAYQHGMRLTTTGPKDSPMEAAMQVAASFEGLDHEGAAETIKKSIQRARKKIQGTLVFTIDPDSLQLQKHDAESALLSGLPGKPGRPGKSQPSD